MFKKLKRLVRTHLLLRRYHRLLELNGRKLHVGCGDDYLDGYINIDADPASRADLVIDVSQLALFPGASVDLIESYHFLEHLYFFDATWTLRQWFRLLKPGGTVVIELPDLDVCVRDLGKHFSDTGYDLAMVGIYGNPPQVKRGGGSLAHKWGWNFNALSDQLSKAGFCDVRRHPVRQEYRKATAFDRDMQVRAMKPLVPPAAQIRQGAN